MMATEHDASRKEGRENDELFLFRLSHMALQPKQRQKSGRPVPADGKPPEEAERQGYYVAGNSQDMSTGRNIRRMGLQQMLKAVKADQSGPLCCRTCFG